LTLANHSANLLTVQASLADAGAPSGLSALGDGTVKLRGDLGLTGDIAIHGGTLVFDQVADQAVSNRFSGSGTIVKEGANLLHLMGTNTYTGSTHINAGTVRVNADTTFGTPDGGVFVASGATLDIGCSADVGGTRAQDALNFGDELFTISGSGTDGGGALVNNSATRQLNAFSRIELAADAAVGGTADWRVQGDAAVLTLHDYILTKKGGNLVDLSRVSVNTGSGHIDVAAGTLRLLYQTKLNGSAANTLTVRSGSEVELYNLTAVQPWHLILESGATLDAASDYADGQNRWAGPVAVGANVTLTAAYDVAGELQGVISGADPVTKTGSGKWILSGTNNTYTGQTRIHGGTLSVTSLRNVGEACSLGQPANAADGAIVIGTGAVTGSALEYVGAGDTSDRVVTMGATTASSTITHNGTGPLKFTGDLAVAAAGDKSLVLRGDSTAPGDFAGGISDGAGTKVAVVKTDAGKWSLSGTNGFTGNLQIYNGELAVAGKLEHGSGNIWIGNYPGSGGIMRILPGGSVNGAYPSATTFCQLIIGSAAGADGALYMDGGTLTRNARLGTTGFTLAYRKNYGYFKMGGGTASGTRLHMGGYNGTTDAGGRSIIRMTGGTLAFAEYMMIARYTDDVGVFTVDGGLVDHAAGSQPLSLGFNGGRGELNLTGGTFDNTAQTLTVCQSSGSSLGLVNLCAGTLKTKDIVQANSGMAVVNFMGGTLKAAAGTTAAFLPAALTGVYSYGALGGFQGGAVIDTDGNDVTLAAPIRVPEGNGVHAIAVATPGAGYLGEPYVSIRGGGGDGAAAIANMEPYGNGRYRVVSITITSPGSGYTETPDVTLEMGGFSTAATLGAVTMLPNVGGGL
ncbi:MAG: autotransporter-associated beta strand repeat-containing protein, partial [Kiritimatiellae bacterium]|nr:autotransporter-associated beta strand repeat-containing protein [Kiritimatiellia bacterium]